MPPKQQQPAPKPPAAGPSAQGAGSAASPATGAGRAEIELDEADEFARALSEAMEATAKADPTAWQSSDGVVVEEGFANARNNSGPPPLPNHGDHGDSTLPDGFEPVPPAEVRRSTPRIPDLSDFPEVAQREYFAKLEANFLVVFGGPLTFST